MLRKFIFFPAQLMKVPSIDIGIDSIVAKLLMTLPATLATVNVKLPCEVILLSLFNSTAAL